MTMPDRNDIELCDVIGALGAGANAARDENLSADDRSLATDLTNDLADRLGNNEQG